MRVRHILFCLLLIVATAACTQRREEIFSNVNMVWNRHTPAAVIFHMHATSGGMAQTQKLEIKFRTPKSDEEMLESLTAEEIDTALLTEAQALILLNANPTWRIIADLGPTTPLAILSRETDSWRERREWVNFAGLAGQVLLAYWMTQNNIDFSALTMHEALPLSSPAGNTGATLLQLACTPLDRQSATQAALQTVAAIPQRLLLLGKAEYIKNHPQGVERILLAWDKSLQHFRDHAADPLPNLADQMHTDVDYLRKLLEDYPLPSASETAAACARHFPADVHRTLEEMAKAGKERGLLRRSFNPREAIP
ncbi:MAG TPA: hypothetical protein PKW95_11025 [bacterium]|nr:hypothetical protein [bacterium]